MRERAGLTQKGMAIKFNIPQKTIENWEQGVSECPKYVLELIKYKMFKEEMIMNTKINYRWTQRYDQNIPDNNFEATSDCIVTDGIYDFEEYLKDRDINYEVEGNFYFVIDDEGERTGEAFWVTSEEPTDEDLHD